ncbi:Ig-like domain-containing protein [Chitinimonas sp. BJYL2]|uniref:Ig-like domain-containing protein n=1 Tax=Chitinimonas sp. BJYL2 TaxID=2976696 RepID=UPI0022B43A63|nr:Ig-like domain-containing protein [Chitinimonas sp. BJYL2]
MPARTPLQTASLLLITLLAPTLVQAADKPAENEGSLQFTGDTARASIGIRKGGDFQGELLGVLSEDARSAWLGQIWLGGSAGGVQLDYHVLGDGAVEKYFVALDQNRQRDHKLSAGYGREYANWFGNAYLSHGLTGKRLVGEQTTQVQTQTSGNDAGRPFVDTLTVSTLSRTFEKAYDLGVGLRLGRYFDETSVRLTGGLDHEWGKAGARQTSVSALLEKFFVGTPHSLALDLEHYRKQGSAEVRRNDSRFVLSYRYNFGKPNSQHERSYRITAEQSAGTPPTVIPERTERKLVKTTASMNADAFFDFSSSKLTPLARTELDRISDVLKQNPREGNIRIVGHTCDIGGHAINDKLSLKRAQAVLDYLISKGGLSADAAVVEGKGKREPRFGATEEGRAKNRRVELEFITVTEKEELVTIAAQTTPGTPATVSYRRELIEQEPAWMRAALRNPSTHKRAVDVYRTVEQTQSTSTTRQWLNRAPSAGNDSFQAVAGVATLLALTSNDNDPDTDDGITLLSVGAANHGQLTIVGNQVRYLAPADFTGEDSFSYQIQDKQGAKAEARVTVTVSRPNVAPVAADDTYTVAAGSSSLLAVTSNDTDADAGDVISIASLGTPAHGQVTIEGNQIRYVAPVGYAGADSFSYKIKDAQGAISEAQVSIAVISPNRAPTAVDDRFWVSGSVPSTVDVLRNDSDPDGDTLTIISVTQPQNGNGTVSIEGNKVVFKPFNLFLYDYFTYTVSDGRGGVATANVTLIDP